MYRTRERVCVWVGAMSFVVIISYRWVGYVECINFFAPSKAVRGTRFFAVRSRV